MYLSHIQLSIMESSEYLVRNSTTAMNVKLDTTSTLIQRLGAAENAQLTLTNTALLAQMR
jgi:hypothetical protein